MTGTMISYGDRTRFLLGDCHYLAREIRKRTGWPIWAFTFDGTPDLHAFVRLPDGRVLDADGVCALETMQRRWRGKTVWRATAGGCESARRGYREVTWEEVRIFGKPRSPATYVRAYHAARALIASCGLEETAPV